MGIVYNWRVSPNGLITEQQNTKTDVVIRVMYSVTASRDGYDAKLNDFVDLTLDSNSVFIPFAELTEETVINWVKNADSAKVALFQQTLAVMLERKINPPIRPVAKPAPWNTCHQA